MLGYVVGKAGSDGEDLRDHDEFDGQIHGQLRMRERGACMPCLVLRDAGGRTRPFILLYPHARYLTSRVRAFVDFLVGQLAAAPAPRKRAR